MGRELHEWREMMKGNNEQGDREVREIRETEEKEKKWGLRKRGQKKQKINFSFISLLERK